MKAEARMEGMWPQAQDRLKPLEAGRGSKDQPQLPSSWGRPLHLPWAHVLTAAWSPVAPAPGWKEGLLPAGQGEVPLYLPTPSLCPNTGHGWPTRVLLLSTISKPVAWFPTQGQIRRRTLSLICPHQSAFTSVKKFILLIGCPWNVPFSNSSKFSDSR